MTGNAPKSATLYPERKLTLLDAVCIIVGTIIGSGIFGTAAVVAGLVPSANWLIFVWILGGAISLVGSICFAELTTAYNEPGGDYYYLRRAFGDPVGLAFAWAAFWIIRPGNIGAMAMVFAEYAVQLFGLPPTTAMKLGLSLAAVLILSFTNLLGVQSGKWTQNVLTIIKVAGIAVIIATAFLLREFQSSASVVGLSSPLSGLFLAMVLVMFTYGGWNDIAFVASEVKRPGRNLLLALIIGTTLVTASYVLFNIALLLGLGIAEFANNSEAATELMSIQWGNHGATFISALVCISCLGAINGMIFTSPRIYFAVGMRYPQFAWLASWGGRRDGPWAGMVCQAAISTGLIFVCGLRKDGFTQILAVTAPYFWLFLSMTFISLIVLRTKEPGKKPGTFRVPLYPLTPLFMALVSVAIIYSSVQYIVAENYFAK